MTPARDKHRGHGPSPDMRVEVAGVSLPNPVIAASGTFGYGIEFAGVAALDKLGGIVTKGLSLEPMPGNSTPRLIETAAGMLNAIGLQNVGVGAFIAEKLPALRQATTAPIIANIFGFAVEDYLAVIDALNQAEGIAAYELNVSCPNTRHGGMVFGCDPNLLGEIVARVRPICRRPLWVKLSPNVTSIAQMAAIAQYEGADAVGVANTFLATAIDAETRRPRLANITGGLSGPAIKPIALRMVMECARAVTIPVIGMGGIVRAEDAVEFLLAGATAVQVGTANYADPRATEKIARDLRTWCARHKVARVQELTGALRWSDPA